jgi:Tfp pilus assembly protein PilF
VGDLSANNGPPLGTYTVELSGQGGGLPIDHTTSNPDGRFEFRGVAAGSYNILVKTQAGDVVGVQYVSNIQVNPQVHVQIAETAPVKPISGTVPVSALQHHAPRQAVQEMKAAMKASQAGDSESAQEHLLAAIRLDPDFSEAHTNLGAQYTRAKKLDLAYTEFQTALRLGPRGAMQYCNLAVIDLAMKRRAEAEQGVRQALAVDSRNPQSNALLGEILAAKPESYDEAVKHLKLAAEEIPSAMFLLAQLYASHGHKQDAIAALESYQQTAPAANREKIQKVILSLR